MNIHLQINVELSSNNRDLEVVFPIPNNFSKINLPRILPIFYGMR